MGISGTTKYWQFALRQLSWQYLKCHLVMIHSLLIFIFGVFASELLKRLWNFSLIATSLNLDHNMLPVMNQSWIRVYYQSWRVLARQPTRRIFDNRKIFKNNLLTCVIPSPVVQTHTCCVPKLGAYSSGIITRTPHWI